MAESLPADDQIDFPICTQVRQDPDNKLSLLGYFAGAEIALDRAAKFPASFSLGVLFVLKDGEGSYAAEFKILNPARVQTVAQPLPKIVKARDVSHTIFLNSESFVAELPGRYTALLELDGHIYTRHFRVRQ